MSDSFFLSIFLQVLKVFCMKIVKAGYSKNIWKEENRGHGFVCPFAGFMSVQINYSNCNFVDAGVHEVQKNVSLWPNFDPYFPDAWSALKR